MKKAIKFTSLLILTLLITIYSCSDDDAVIINIENLEVTIDENPTIGQIIGTIQSDSNGALTFSIDTQTPSGALSIDANTGELTVVDASLFDFETNPTITAIVSAVEASNTATVTVNLNNLEVTLQDLAVSIDENPTAGQVLGTIVSNGTGTLNYSLMSQTPNGALSIDANSGELTVADATLFDFETNPIITASVSDGEATNAATVTINLANVLEVTIQEFDESIDENPSNGQVIGTITSDAVGNPNFSIVSQTPAGAMAINSSTGELTVADASLFDHEINQFVDAVIAADDAMNLTDFELEIDNVNEIGDFNYGGVIFWVNATGDEGLVCTITDQSFGTTWSEGTNLVTGANGTATGTGEANTNLIVSNHLSGTYAAWLCAAHNENGYSDWFLPSQDELNELYLNRATVNTTLIANGGTEVSAAYWTSTEANLNEAWYQTFTNGSQFSITKTLSLKVRAVRAWTDF